MGWFHIVMLIAVTALPAAVVIGSQIKMRRFVARWQEEAARLGLESEGSIPHLRISGTMNGVEIDLVQWSTFPAKQAAEYWYIARARVPTQVEDVILSSYRTEPRRAEDPLARDVFTDLTPFDGWFELHGHGTLAPDDIEPLLRRLVRTAKAEALAQAEREEEERRQADRR